MADEQAVPVAASPSIPAALREAADWLESHPDVPPHSVDLCDLRHGFGPARIIVFPHTADRMAELARSVGGCWQKTHGTHTFDLRQEVALGVEVELSASRDAVCERVQTGTRTVEVPDPELVAEVPVVTVQEPVYEWRCQPLLAGSREASSGTVGSE